MGEARNRRLQAEQLASQRAGLEVVVKQVSHALRRLAEAASANLGRDCYMHAELGRVLLADQGLTFQTKVGFAAWRVGSGDGDVISHTSKVQGYLPPGALGFAYHAWLESAEWLVDLTTYQLRRKAKELDEADGGHTTVDWCPEYLLLPRSNARTYRQVAQAPDAGSVYYEAVPELATKMSAGFELDANDVANVRLIYSSPDMQVIGPNMMPQDQ